MQQQRERFYVVKGGWSVVLCVELTKCEQCIKDTFTVLQHHCCVKWARVEDAQLYSRSAGLKRIFTASATVAIRGQNEYRALINECQVFKTSRTYANALIRLAPRATAYEEIDGEWETRNWIDIDWRGDWCEDKRVGPKKTRGGTFLQDGFRWCMLWGEEKEAVVLLEDRYKGSWWGEENTDDSVVFLQEEGRCGIGTKASRKRGRGQMD